MKVFISWSGEPSRSVARSLHGWIRKVLQSVEPWMSDEDLQRGGRWHQQLSTELKDTNYGLICLTKANQNSAWLNFEAGAISKHMESTRVVVVLLDLLPSEIVTPLKEFQATRLERTEFLKTMKQMNALTARPLPDSEVEEQFEIWWPRLEPSIKDAMDLKEGPAVTRRPEREMLAELLDLVRGITRNANVPAGLTYGELAGLRDIPQRAPRSARQLAHFITMRLPWPDALVDLVRTTARGDITLSITEVPSDDFEKLRATLGDLLQDTNYSPMELHPNGEGSFQLLVKRKSSIG